MSDAHTAEKDAALARVRTWVEAEVSDWSDPVIGPDLNDALRVVVGLPPQRSFCWSCATWVDHSVGHECDPLGGES